MSIGASLFAGYVFVGFALIIVAVASKSFRERACFPVIVPDGIPGTVIVFGAALLWPLWFVFLLLKNSKN